MSSHYSSGAAAPGVAPQSETEESEKWHRRFAMRCNNRAWVDDVRARKAALERIVRQWIKHV